MRGAWFEIPLEYILYNSGLSEKTSNLSKVLTFLSGKALIYLARYKKILALYQR